MPAAAFESNLASDPQRKIHVLANAVRRERLEIKNVVNE
jgi:hypothetical protein